MGSSQGDYREIRDSIMRALNAGVDKSEIIVAVSEGAASIIDSIFDTSLGDLHTLCMTARDTVSMRGAPDTVPNPWVVANGHADDDADRSYTRKYMRSRAIKGIAGSLAGFASGRVADVVTQVDVVGAAQHANAFASSKEHLVKLMAIGAGHKQSQTITEWVNLLLKMKALKMGIRGTQLAGALIPVGWVGTALGIGAGLAKLGVKLKFGTVCAMTAADIHWRAYQEQAISVGLFKRGGKIGPASNMMYEMFYKRGATRIFGQYDVDRIIKEPTGWMCLNDKLMLT